VPRAEAPIKNLIAHAQRCGSRTARGLQIVNMIDPEDDEILQTNDRKYEICRRMTAMVSCNEGEGHAGRIDS
jgi:hypothetical protein